MLGTTVGGIRRGSWWGRFWAWLSRLTRMAEDASFQTAAHFQMPGVGSGTKKNNKTAAKLSAPAPIRQLSSAVADSGTPPHTADLPALDGLLGGQYKKPLGSADSWAAILKTAVPTESRPKNRGALAFTAVYSADEERTDGLFERLSNVGSALTVRSLRVVLLWPV